MLRFVTVKQDRLSKTLNTENNISKFEIGPVQNKLWIPLFEAKITLIQQKGSAESEDIIPNKGI